MNSEYEGLFKNLGYDVKLKGAMLFNDLLDEVRNLLKEGMSDKEIKEFLPSIYLEYYHFCYEIGRYKYFNELDAFCNSRKVTKKNMSTNRKVMNMRPNMNLENSLLFFSKYYNNLEKKNNLEKEKAKLLVLTAREG